jgi:hypothetical protein
MPKQGEDSGASFRSYYAGLTTEDSKLRFMQMLKERRDWHGDSVAAKLLPEICARWIGEKSPGR